ncbi:Spc98 family-domain-containing protein [Syncephalastrum racemosum]|uniref:Spc98 family-domain-containing protein n=1 Tax=Syncephalastrum racemosum TaxID=13706 RepID=A0A1X2HSV2_SYNRA|nr:Spc98 family-domain-containing protein [Syncephalastrum racemosum]
MSFSPRNTRRRLAREHESHVPARPEYVGDRSLPPAVQLANAREQRRELEDTVPESALLRDLIFVFQGIDGQHIKLDCGTNEYVLDASRGHVSQPTKDFVLRLAELGWLYRRVQTFVHARYNDPSVGLVGQAFCFALQRELTDYYKFIAILEGQIEKQTTASTTEQTLTLKRLLVWTRDSFQRLRLMSVLVDACQDQKGGTLVSTMHNYTKHGDPFIQQFIKDMLEEVSKPFYEMLQRWVYEGELDDPYGEFFVACDPMVSEEELWQSKYSIRKDMIPSYISNELAQKIFSIGKSLNFIRYSCHDDTLVNKYHAPEEPVQTFQYGNILAVTQSIDDTYRETSKRLLDLLRNKYKLMDHLQALKRYLLLGQGDFIQYLMDTLGPGLSRPANTLLRHNLTGVLETAVRASNAQYDDPEILNRLDVRLLEISSGDLGWDVFTLDYHVDSPINTVFSPKAMNLYLRMFNFLWRLKRVEYTLTAAWRRWGIAARTKLADVDQHLRQDLHQAQMTISRMVHFVYQLQHYYLFEVLECSWEKLKRDINNDKTMDLDAIIEAHLLYLREITEKGFLDGGKNQALSGRLNAMFDTILKYKIILDHLYAYVTKPSESGVKSNGTGSGERLQKIRSRHSEIENKFENQVHEFLDILVSSYHDEDLRSLSTRLDYNDYYAHFQSTTPPMVRASSSA